MGIQPKNLRKGIAALLATWAVALLIGISLVENYKNTPGRAGQEIQRAPASIALDLDPSQPTLVIFAHPLCSCSRATIAELEQLLLKHKGAFATRVYFYMPLKEDKEWSGSDIIARARSLRSVKVLFDRQGRIARQTGAHTSGQTYLFSPDGKLEFMGGITGARGHEGENAGTRAISALLEKRSPASVRTRVFGCGLFKQTSALTVDGQEKR